jgi:hypothetical protein
MSKLIGEPIKVHENKDATPDAFIWRRRLYRVKEVVGWWREPAEWWREKTMRFFVRVVAKNSNSGTYELYRLADQWFLHRVLD